MVTADPEGRPNSLPYIGLCIFLIYPGMVTVGPGRRPKSLLQTGVCTFHIYPGAVTVGPGRRPNSLLHTGVCTALVVGFSLAQNPGVHGADLLSFSGALRLPLPPFEPHQVVVSVDVKYNNFGSPNTRKSIKARNDQMHIVAHK